jgi:hypothetical protein
VPMIEIYTGTILSEPTFGLLDDGARVTYAPFQKDHADLDRKYGVPCESPWRLSVFHSFTAPESTEVIDRCIAGDRVYLEGGRVGRRKFSAFLVRLIPLHLDAMAILMTTQAELDAFYDAVHQNCATDWMGPRRRNS